MNELALFAGAGGGILGGHLLGWRTVCAVEIEDYPRQVLLARQRDGILPRFPIWDDVTTFDGREWKGRVDVVSGGFPCQDISCAGSGAGLGGSRSGLWSEMARIIGEVQPRYVFVENSPMLTSRGIGVVLGDLAALGYDARWGVLGAADVGGCHIRSRLWVVAYATDHGCTWRGAPRHGWVGSENILRGELWREVAGGLCGVDDGVAGRLGHKFKAIGNGQVPAVAALAWETLNYSPQDPTEPTESEAS